LQQYLSTIRAPKSGADSGYETPNEEASEEAEEDDDDEPKIQVDKCVVYTYTNIMEKINLDENHHECLAETFKQQEDVVKELETFIKHEKQECLIIRFLEKNCKHLKLLKFLVESSISSMKEEPKVRKSLVFVIHIQKDSNFIPEYFSFLNDWEQVVIDSLNDKFNLDFQKCFEFTLKQIFEEFYQEELNRQLNHLLSKAFMRLRYMRKDQYNGNISQYTSEMIK